MGQYWNTFLYKGVLVDKDSKDEMPKKQLKYKDSKQYLGVYNKIIYYDNFVQLANVDPIIESHEIKQGFVSLTEVLDLIKNSKNLELKERWGTPADLEDIYILQGSWCSLEPGDNSLHMNYNLKCV